MNITARTGVEVLPPEMVGTVEEEMDRAGLSPMLRLLYAMLHEMVLSLGWLRKRGAWVEHPDEMESALTRGALPPRKFNRNQRVREVLAWERRLWGSGTKALLDAIEVHGGPRIQVSMVIRGAKRMSEAGANGRVLLTDEERIERKRKENEIQSQVRRQRWKPMSEVGHLIPQRNRCVCGRMPDFRLTTRKAYVRCNHCGRRGLKACDSREEAVELWNEGRVSGPTK